MKPRWKKLYEGAFCLTDTGPAGIVSMFLLVGTEKALLIDSGYGLLDLPALIAEITDKPVIQVNTHGHMDHANGSWQFATSYLRSEDMDVYQKHVSAEFMYKRFGNEVDTLRLEAMLSASPAKLLSLNDVSFFDLGGRGVEVLHMPGHTRGSVCLLDKANCAAFTGDNLCRSIWLSLPESVSVSEYKAVLEQLLPVLQRKGILWNYAAHSPRKARIEDDICRFMNCCDAILKGNAQPKFINNGETSGYFVGKSGRYILYQNI